MLETILLSFGGQLIGKLVAKKFGDEFGDLTTGVIDQLGSAFGIDNPHDNPDKLADAIKKAPPATARETIGRIEAETADALLARTKLQEAENVELSLVNQQLKDQAQGPWFGWAWRPFWMWLLAAFWTWNIIVLHVINAWLKIALPPTDLQSLLWLTAAYLGLYMGGHTIKDFVNKKWGNGA